MATDYISREAAIANSREYNLGGSYDNTERAVPVDTINSIPAADVRPVVLCRDCKHADFAGMGNGTVWCDKMERAMQEDDFCSWGVKMEES